MEKSEIFKHVRGYVAGIFIFVILIPLVIYGTSKIPLFQTQLFSSDTLKNIIAIPLLIVGVIFIIWSNLDLFRIGKGGPADAFNVSISPKTKKLVVSGPYKYTRNPMVFGANSLYFSWAIYLNVLITLLFVSAFFCMAVSYLKFSEEKRLLRDFGDDFRRYKKRVSMILPLPPKK